MPAAKEQIRQIIADHNLNNMADLYSLSRDSFWDIHMLRNSFKYVNYSNLKKFSSDFKAVYNAPNEISALSELETISDSFQERLFPIDTKFLYSLWI